MTYNGDWFILIFVAIERAVYLFTIGTLVYATREVIKDFREWR